MEISPSTSFNPAASSLSKTRITDVSSNCSSSFFQTTPQFGFQFFAPAGSKHGQTGNKARMQAIADELRIASSADSDVRRFIEEIWEYASFTELYETILNRLIDKTFISAVEVVDGEKVQKARIIYNFLGEIAN